MDLGFFFFFLLKKIVFKGLRALTSASPCVKMGRQHPTSYSYV